MDCDVPLSNERHERFALLLAGGEVSVVEAFKQEVWVEGSEGVPEVAGPALARTKAVKGRVAWIREQVRVKAVERAEVMVMSILEKRRFLARVVRANGASIDLERDGDLVEGVRLKTGGLQELILPSKLAAMKMDNDLAGEGAEADGNEALAALVRRLRR